MNEELVTLNTYHLFYLLFENKSVEEKKVNVLRCLEQGGDVNAVDGRRNTPLHIAVIKGEPEIVQILLEKGAVPHAKNQKNKSPLDIAKNLLSNNSEEIVQLLLHAAANFKQPSKVKPKTAVQKPIDGIANKSVQNTPTKRPGTSGYCGQLYETKLLNLVLLRALNDKDIEDFRLGTNINGIGALDDMCLKLKLKGHDKTIMVYLQAKHRENREKGLLTVENVRNDKGDFSLIKYFDSYLKIKENYKPNNSDVMFNGEFSNNDTYVIIYTPVKDLFTRKLIGNHEINGKVHELISTATQNPSASSSKQYDHRILFQFEYEESDIESLTKMTVQNCVKRLGLIFLDFIMAENDKSETMMANEHIIRYHYVFSQQVIIVSDIFEVTIKKELKRIRYGSFRPEFFTSSSEHLLCLREIFYKEISSTYCDKRPIENNNFANRFQDIVKNPNALHISRVIGKFATYNDKTYRLEIKKECHKETELEAIRVGLSTLEIQPDVIRQAVWLKLQEMTFILPTQFGNLDMYFRGTTDKVNNRIKDVVKKLITFFNHFQESKIVKINDETVGKDKLIQRGLLEINGGIGGAVGNLLILDDDKKRFKFGVDLFDELPNLSKDFLREFLINIDKGELMKYKLEVNIYGFPKYTFDGDQYDKRQAEEFLNKLWFYTNQAQEDGVETLIKDGITKYYNNAAKDKESVFKIHTDAIYLLSHEKVQKWWKDPSKAPTFYLDPKNQYFKEAKDKVIDSPLLSVLNFLFIRKLQKLEISFNQAAVDSLNLHQRAGRRLNIKTNTTILTALKISQFFHSKDNFTFIEFDYVLNLPSNDYNTLIKDLKETKMKYLIIIYEKLKHEGNTMTYESINTKLKEIMSAFNGDNIIVVSKNIIGDGMGTLEGEYKSLTDRNNLLMDLTKDSQKSILENYSKVVFQGDEIYIKRTIKKISDN